MTPTVRTAGSTAKYCHSSRSRPARRISSITIRSAARRVASRSEVTSPMIRTARPRAGERLALHHVLGQAQLGADPAHLVLEQQAQWLDQLEIHVVGEAADVVVALDGRGPRAARLDHVRVEGALDQVASVAVVPGHLLEYPDELVADRLALALRVGDAGQPLEEPVRRLDVHQVDLEIAPEGLLDLLGLAVAQQARVHEDAGEPVADGPVHEQGRD